MDQGSLKLIGNTALVRLQNIKIPNDLVLPFDGTLNMGKAVVDYFDRLYFSVITQTTLGYGDIFPASRKVRIISMFQALSTVLIFII